tara:strand:- start:4814 stop:6460 length:1647 start_codon:yes stop_codon:yes gene_type:complete
LKIKFTKPKVADYNGLFKMVSNNEGLAVKRSNKNADNSPINTWQNAQSVQLRGGASREENLLVSGRLAHPAPIVDSRSVVQAIRRGSRNILDVDDMLLQQLLAAAEYARGARVSDGHYSNPEISGAATEIIQVTKPEYIRTTEKIAENAALRLLNAPIKWDGIEEGFPTSGIAAITGVETLDENVKSFYERFLVQVMPLVVSNKEELTPPPPPPIDENEGGGQEGVDKQPVDKQPDPEAKEPEVPPAPPTKVEQLVEHISSSLATNAKENFERFKDQQKVTAETLGALDNQPTARELQEINEMGVPEVFRREWEQNLEWVAPKFNLSSISPIQDDGQSIRSFTGMPTGDVWKMSMLGNVNVMDSTSTSGDAASLLILADISGSTRDKEVTTQFGRGCTQDAIWALAGKLLELSVNSRSYGFYASHRKTVSIVEGQKAGRVPRLSVGGGGTPTAEVLAWAADKSESSDDVIVLITDGLPDHKAPAMVKRMTDNGSRVAVVVVPNTHDMSDLSRSQRTARQFGGEMSTVCDVRNPRSIDALNEFMANLIV